MTVTTRRPTRNLLVQECPTCGEPHAELDYIEKFDGRASDDGYTQLRIGFICNRDLCPSKAFYIKIHLDEAQVVLVNNRQIGGACPSGCGENLILRNANLDVLEFECITGKWLPGLGCQRWESHAGFTVKLPQGDKLWSFWIGEEEESIAILLDEQHRTRFDEIRLDAEWEYVTTLRNDDRVPEALRPYVIAGTQDAVAYLKKHDITHTPYSFDRRVPEPEEN